jgi:hypothetical protein
VAIKKPKPKDEPEPEDVPVKSSGKPITATSITGPRQAHNPNTCRLYGCLQCQAKGVKNDKRGLK